MIKLVSSDKVEMEVEKKAAFLSEMIRNLVEDIGMDGSVPLANVDGATLKIILEWCNHHVDDPPVNEERKERIYSFKISEWDRGFMPTDQDTLVKIILAANYLNIPLLIDIGCKLIADKMSGLSIKELRQMWGIESDFTPSEEAAVRRENA